MKTVWFGLIGVFGLASLWDGFTTVAGTYSILGSGGVELLMSLIFALVIAAFLLCTSPIFDQGDDFLGNLLRFFWFIALAYDIYTSFMGNRMYIITNRDLDAGKAVLLAGMTVLVSGSPIFFSLIWHKRINAYD